MAVLFYLLCFFSIIGLIAYLKTLSPKNENDLFEDCDPETCMRFKAIHYTKRNGEVLKKVPQACFFYEVCPASRRQIK